MIIANGKEYEYREGMKLPDVFECMGYTLKKPSLLVHVNGNLVKKENWDSFVVPDKAVIEIVNLLRGG